MRELVLTPKFKMQFLGKKIMKAFTIRGVKPEVTEILKRTAKKQDKSVNHLMLEFIKKGLGLQKEKNVSRQYDDLDDLFGRWSEDECKNITDSITRQRQIGPEFLT